MCEPTTSNGRASTSDNADDGADAAEVSNDHNVPEEVENEDDSSELPSWFRVRFFTSLLLMDLHITILFLIPILPSLNSVEGATWSTDGFSISSALYDLAALAVLRILTAFYSLLRGYAAKDSPASPFESHHANGDKKTREELEEEALEEPLGKYFGRYMQRSSFPCEVVCLLSGIWTIVKCLMRLDAELGLYNEDHVPLHPIYWLVLLWTSIICVVVTLQLDAVSLYAGECRRARMTVRPDNEGTSAGTGWVPRIASNLSIPLLSAAASVEPNEVEEETDVEDVDGAGAPDADTTTTPATKPEEVRGESDITGDSSYKATWADLLSICKPDLHFIAVAFIFLLLAATAEIMIPTYTGDILDDLSKAFASPDEDHSKKSMWEVPGFISNVIQLVVASILCGIFSALRGSIFTIVGGRVNVRLRIQLMDALLAQDIGFFDVTKTGDITSRLSSDTTLVGDQVSLNVNVFMRSMVQMIGVLIFMFWISWQLSLLAFISVPVITILSKWYGNYVRALTKLMQKKLADGNSVSEAAMGSMSTVRAFDAAESELQEFEKFMKQYLDLNTRSAVAYLGYCSCVTALPNLVTAVVLFYGGLLVRNGDMSSGKLVSFLLYLQSLSSAFASVGYIFSSLTQAVGAADKVFELMNRKPKLTPPSANNQVVHVTRGIMGIEATKTATQRLRGVAPVAIDGRVSLNNVEMYYPARPQRRILNQLSLTVPPGSVVALVGPSGSGKSSIMSLVQHLYEPKQGSVQIDEFAVNDLQPQWLSRNVSVVSQEPTLFARSIARNIMYGLEGTPIEPTLDEIKEAARLANAHSFIEALPFGYETDVGERGVQLSGGQKQRIAIARALVRKPRILLLDEATSALDAESEALVQEAIDDMLVRGRPTKNGNGSISEEQAPSGPNMTVLIVAHRLSTVRNADIIFVIRDGVVVEQGSHEELVAKEDGEYTNLINRQMNAQKKLESGTK